MSKTIIDSSEKLVTAVTKFVETDVVRKVYGEVLHPPAVAVGQIAELGLRVAAAPLEILKRLAHRVVDRVPPNRLLPAPLELAGPLLDAARWKRDGDPLFDMFEELLVTACDSDSQGQANPAYVGLIQQLSPDEARLLYWIRQREVVVQTSRWFKTTDHMGLKLPEHGTEIVSFEFPYWRFGNSDGLAPEAYVAHVKDLGLVGTSVVDRATFGRRDVQTKRLLFTSYGTLFANACIPVHGFESYADDMEPSMW